MRHNRQTHRFGRNPKERQAMLENLVTSLLKSQAIQTTLKKAKATQRLAEHVITLGKKNSLAARRQVFSYLQDHDLTSKLFKEVAPRFKDRKGGYTRILQLQRRKGDGAPLALLELTEKEVIVKEIPKSKRKLEKEKPVSSHKHSKAEEEVSETETPKDETAKGKVARDKETHPKHPQQKTGFFRNISKFFRNKGGS